MMSGILKVDKPSGPTSHDVVNRVREMASTKRVGHSGTLDPFATGLLLVGIEKGTRILEYLLHMDKTYEVVAQLGIVTDTFDEKGKVVERHDCNVDENRVREVLKSFVGEYKQVPPMYSSKKYKGTRLYKLARAGKIITMPPKPVKIHSITILKIELPYVYFTAVVSEGTYIRGLCRDMGIKLGCGAIAHKLRRTRIGPFSVEDAVNVYKSDQLKERDLITLEEVTKTLFPTVVISEKATKSVLNGQPVNIDGVESFDEFGKKELVRIVDPSGKFISIAVSERKSTYISTLKKLGKLETVLRPKKVFD